MRTVDKKGKEAACELMNEMCGVNVDDVSGTDNQCECLIGAVTVCVLIDYIYVFSYYSPPYSILFRTQMTIQYVMKLG